MLTGSYRWNPGCHSRTVRSGQYRGKASTVEALDASYVAGFLDGDGSIHFHLVRQRDFRFGFYTRASVSFSQASKARAGLEYLRSMVGAGCLRDRGTGMSDLVITSRPVIFELLRDVEPYVVFKRDHVRTALALLPRLDRIPDSESFLQLARDVDAFAALNYSKRKQVTAADLEQYLRSKGVLCPCNDFLARYSEEMASSG